MPSIALRSCESNGLARRSASQRQRLSLGWGQDIAAHYGDNPPITWHLTNVGAAYLATWPHDPIDRSPHERRSSSPASAQ